MRKVAEHTSGPWQVHAAGCAAVPPYVRVAKYWPQAGAYQIIADCSHEVTHGTECEANARLIAAAPELLEALRAIKKIVDDAAERPTGFLVADFQTATYPNSRDAYSALCAAITKAGGRSDA